MTYETKGGERGRRRKNVEGNKGKERKREKNRHIRNERFYKGRNIKCETKEGERKEREEIRRWKEE